MLPYLKTGGHVVVSTRAVKPVTATLSGFDYDAPQMLDYLKANVPNLTFVNADQACSDIGSSKVLNMVLLGAAIRTGVLDFTISEIESIMKQTLPEKFHEMNLRALELQYITIRSIINQPLLHYRYIGAHQKKGEGIDMQITRNTNRTSQQTDQGTSFRRKFLWKEIRRSRRYQHPVC